MNKRSKKGLKPFAIKYVALLMGICYLANPLHQQIRTALHEISHLLEAPESLLSHHTHNTGHQSDNHKDGEHSLANAEHQHNLLDLMDSIFDASDGQHPNEDTELIPISFDKHISSLQIGLPRKFPNTTSQNTNAIAQKIKMGYLSHFEEPPQKLSV